MPWLILSIVKKMFLSRHKPAKVTCKRFQLVSHPLLLDLDLLDLRVLRAFALLSLSRNVIGVVSTRIREQGGDFFKLDVSREKVGYVARDAPCNLEQLLTMYRPDRREAELWWCFLVVFIGMLLLAV